MRGAIIAFGFLLACITQALALAGQQRTVMMQPPGWVLQGQPVSMDWARGRYWVPGMGYTGPLVLTTTTRASTKYCQMLSGIWQTTNNNNYPAICDQGVLPEEARTNDALWSRDMTQAGSWTLVGDTVALNAVGIDGQANSASTLTATGTASSCAASCTALQSITLGSSADTYSVWLKRVTGSGAVNITINNLTGTTACTLVTTAFTRCSVTATLANPVIGIQMTTVGDVIIADFNQMEPGGFATSPILTTSATATRAADIISGVGPISQFFTSSNVSFSSSMSTTQNPLTTNQIFTISDGTNSNILQLSYGAGSLGGLGRAILIGGVGWNSGNTSTPAWSAAPHRISVLFSNLNNKISVDGVVTATSVTGTLPPTRSLFLLGSGPTPQYLNGFIINFSISSLGVLQ